MFSYKFKAEKTIYFPFKLKKDQSNRTYDNTEMPPHKVSNQRSYRKISIILHYANLPMMQIFLEISKTCLKHHILTYNKNRL